MQRKSACLKISLVCLAAVCALMATFLQGCQSGTTGTFRPIDQQTLTSITNAITSATQTAAPVLPAPFGSVFEGVGALAVAGLALWQTVTHKTSKENKAAIAQLQSPPKL